MKLSKDQLKQCMPKVTEANITRFIDPINNTFERYEINTPKRMACFLAQIAHESGCLRFTKEIATGEAYDVGKLAVNLGNTPEDDGDGEMYKGRGLIQITGKRNYEDLSKDLGVDFLKQPELLEGPEFAALSAGWFWKSKGLNTICDKPDNWIREWRGNSYYMFQWLTIKINGGLNGYADRMAYYILAKRVFGIN